MFDYVTVTALLFCFITTHHAGLSRMGTTTVAATMVRSWLTLVLRCIRPPARLAGWLGALLDSLTTLARLLLDSLTALARGPLHRSLLKVQDSGQVKGSHRDPTAVKFNKV